MLISRKRRFMGSEIMAENRPIVTNEFTRQQLEVNSVVLIRPQDYGRFDRRYDLSRP
jgi:hypothetical protein